MTTIVSIDIEGIDTINAALEAFEGDIDMVAKVSLDQSLGKIAAVMKSSAMTRFNEGTGNLVRSIGHNAVIGKQDGLPKGSVGVYDMEQSAGPNRQSRYNQPLIAHILNEGAQPHSLAPGSRAPQKPSASKPNGTRGRGQDLAPFHPGVEPTHFLRQAFEANFDTIFDVTVRNMNQRVDKI